MKEASRKRSHTWYDSIYIKYPEQASLVAQRVKNLPAMQETGVWSLGQEDPQEERVAAHSSVPAWRVPVDGGAWWVTFHGIPKH